MSTSATDVMVSRKLHLTAAEEAFILRAVAPLAIPAGSHHFEGDWSDMRMVEAIRRARALYAAVQALKPIEQVLPTYGRPLSPSVVFSPSPIDGETW